MTVKDYIRERFQTFGIQLSEADLLDIVEDAGLENGDIERDASNKVCVSVAMAKFIPSLLLRAQSMSEGGCSMSWNIQGVKDYYFFLCSEYNLPNKLGSRIKIHDIADYL